MPSVMKRDAVMPMAIEAAMVVPKLNASVVETVTAGRKPGVVPATNRGPKRAVMPTNPRAIRTALAKGACARSGVFALSCEIVPKVGLARTDRAGHWDP